MGYPIYETYETLTIPYNEKSKDFLQDELCLGAHLAHGCRPNENCKKCIAYCDNFKKFNEWLANTGKM